MAEKWLAKEVELNRRHEELLIRREVILSGTEAFYDSQNARASSFIASFPKARERNRQFLKDLKDTKRQLYTKAVEPSDPRFNTLKNNYWTMVKNVLPVWQDELMEYKQRIKSARSSARSDRSNISRTPRSITDVNTPRSDTGEAHLSNVDVHTPRSNTQVKTPRSNTEVKTPRSSGVKTPRSTGKRTPRFNDAVHTIH